MRNVGKVNIQLLNGKGYGPRIAEIGNWVGKGFFAPKADLPQLLRDHEEQSSKPGVYCLKYLDPFNGAEMVYIGEADCVSDRLLQHLRSPAKGHFIEVMFFVSYNDWLTKTQVKYLEHRLIDEAHKVGARIMNGNRPSEPRIQASERNDLEDFLDCIMLLLPVMGFRFMLKEFIPIVEEFDISDIDAEKTQQDDEPDILLPKPRRIPRENTTSTVKSAAEWTSNSKESISSISQDEPKDEVPMLQLETQASEPTNAFLTTKETEAEPKDEEKRTSNSHTVRPKPEPQDSQIAPEVGKYRIVDKYVKAVMDIVDGYYVVRKGSQARKDRSQSISQTYIAIRAILIEEGILKEEGEFYVFTQDHPFTSPSAASNVVLGRQSPGPRMWVDADNRSLRGIINDDTSR